MTKREAAKLQAIYNDKRALFESAYSLVESDNEENRALFSKLSKDYWRECRTMEDIAKTVFGIDLYAEYLRTI